MPWKTATLAGVLVVVLGVSMYMLGQSPTGSEEATGSESVMLYCGAGIRPAVKPAIDAFEKKTGIRVETNYGGSGQLFGQLSSRRKGDLYMPGAEHYVDRGVKKGLADGDTKRRVAFFIPVILVQKNNPKDIKTLKDFTRDGLKLGLGQPKACAIGKRTVKIFKKNSIPYPRVKENVVYHSTTVNELGVAVEMKQVDATIMWDANARNFRKVGEIIRIPPEKNIPSIIPIVRLSFSEKPEKARRFIEFITSSRAQEIFKEHGYTTSRPGKGKKDS